MIVGMNKVQTGHNKYIFKQKPLFMTLQTPRPQKSESLVIVAVMGVIVPFLNSFHCFGVVVVFNYFSSLMQL